MNLGPTKTEALVIEESSASRSSSGISQCSYLGKSFWNFGMHKAFGALTFYE